MNTPNRFPACMSRRGTSAQAATLMRGIIAHHIAAHAEERHQLPQRVQWALDRRARAVQRRRTRYRNRRSQIAEQALNRQRGIDAHRGEQGRDYGIEL